MMTQSLVRKRIAGHEIVEVLGSVVRGSTVRARNIGRDIFAGLKNIVGGEIEEYTRLAADSREEALERMVKDAQTPGCGCSGWGSLTTTAMIMQGASEMLAYGTAVKLK